MRSSWTRKSFAALAFALTLGVSACGDDEVGPGEWTLDDLEGTWVITRYEYSADADANETFDLIEEGTTGELVINGNGGYTITFDTPGLPQPVVATGTLSIDANGNVVDSDEGGVINITREGDTITIRDETESFDFDDDPQTPDEPADLLIVMELQN